MGTKMTTKGLLAAARRRAIAPILAAACLALCAGVLSATLPGVAAAQDAARRHIALETSKGRLIRLDTPVKTVFIADPNVADVQVKSPTLIYLTGKKPGETTLIAVDEQDKVLVNAGITVNHNLSRLKRTIDAVIPNNRIHVRSVDGAVVLTGEAESPLEVTQAMELAGRFVERPTDLVNSIAIKGPNIVNLRVRIVEMQRDVTRQIGINWDVAARAGTFAFGLATGAIPLIPTPSIFGPQPITTGAYNTRRAVNANTVNNVYGRHSAGNFDLSALVDLLEQDGYVKTLAQPNLSAMSGKSAAFLAGGEFPIPVAQQDGVVTIEFKKFGVSLAFTPTILSGNRINLRVAPEVSQLAASTVVLNSITIPGLTTRRADTMVEMASGQSFAIAGLLQNNVVRNSNKVPWLGDVPVLGKLFNSESFQRNETELVIIVTPYIVGALKDTPNPDLKAPPPENRPETPRSDAPPARSATTSAPVKASRFQLD
jgi:pilus assembly protein CpaC